MAKPYARERQEYFKLIGGHMKGKKFLKTGLMLTILGTASIEEAATKGSIAAKHAIKYDNYTDSDAPFYCGTIKGGSYIIAAKHIGPLIVIPDKPVG